MQKLKDWTGVTKVHALKEAQDEQKTRLNRAFDRLDEVLRKQPPKREFNGTE